MTRPRHFLFLQGNASWFFQHLGKALADRGHQVTRINVCGGDWHFWGDWHAIDFTGTAADWPDFVAGVMADRGITDIVLQNDCRTLHRQAIAVAEAKGILPWVFEEGYLRPNWQTLERHGINGFTRLPADPDWIRAKAATLPPFSQQQPVGAGMRGRVIFDFQWQWANYRHLLRWPRYRTHRPYPIWAEYLTWVRRLVVLKHRKKVAARVVADLTGGARPYFLFPLQLDSDSQIRVHSRFARLPAAIDAVIDNFAAHAPADALLVVKNHPLDNAWLNYPRLVRTAARRAGVAERVIFIDGGDLNALIDHARGTVTVNSTVGMTAVERGGPTICLGRAVYDMAGLTFQGRLAAFWTAPTAPDPSLWEAFRTVVLHTAMINGNYYSDEGVAIGVANAVKRMEDPTDPLADAPPRGDLPQRI